MQEKKIRYANMALMLVLIIAVLFFGPLRRTEGIRITSVKGENSFEITGPDNFQYVLRLAEINEVSLEEGFVYGIPAGGKEVQNCLVGIWENDSLGKYTAAADKKIDLVAIISTDNDMLVLNFETADATRSLYKGLMDYKNSNSQ